MSSTASGDVIEYEYNLFNLATSASRNGVATTYAYDNFGRNISETTGTKVITRTYNTSGQVASMTLTDGETVLQTSEYEYNVLGNMTSASDGTNTVTYTYNENGLPINEEKGVLLTAYTYTPGNLLKQVSHTRRLTNDTTDEEYYNDIRAISSFAYTYYPDGNVQSVTDTRGSKVNVTYHTYDSANRLTQTEAIGSSDNLLRRWQYTYNNRGDRIGQSVTDSEGVTTSTSYTYMRDTRGRFCCVAESRTKDHLVLS